MVDVKKILNVIVVIFRLFPFFFAENSSKTRKYVMAIWGTYVRLEHMLRILEKANLPPKN